MKCRRFDRLISLFLDGRLDRDGEKELKGHLSECERCAGKLALLESVEGSAKSIETIEPPVEYWDTFSRRVAERIDARKKESPAHGLREAIGGVFSRPRLKLKIAAGLASIALVVIAGKMYMDHHGRGFLSPKKITRAYKRARHEPIEGEKQTDLSAETVVGRGKTIPEQFKAKGESAVMDLQEVKESGLSGTEGDKDVRSKKVQRPAQTEALDQASAPTPDSPDDALSETRKQPVEKAVSTEPGQRHGDEGKKLEGPSREEKHAREDRIHEAETVFGRKRGKKAEPEDADITDGKVAVRTVMLPDHYMVNGTKIPKVEYNDTLMHDYKLRELIQRWKLHIEKSPHDSLNHEGYMQIATAYYLLAKLSGDPAVISAGTRLIENYIDRIEDPALKDRLRHTLIDINSLKLNGNP